MTSAVSIANLALSHIGDEANLSSMTEQSVQAEHCNRYYPIARRSLIEKHTWSFATRRASLALLTEEPPSSWQFAYAIPTLCLKPFAVLMPGYIGDTQEQDFTVETLASGNRVIYTNTEQAVLRYVVDVEDTTKFTPMFIEALSRLLASYIAGPIIKGREGMRVSQGQLEWFTQFSLPQALASDSNMSHTDLYNTFVPGGLKARR